MSPTRRRSGSEIDVVRALCRSRSWLSRRLWRRPRFSGRLTGNKRVRVGGRAVSRAPLSHAVSMNVRIRLQCGRSVTFERCAADMRQSKPECARGGAKRTLGGGSIQASAAWTSAATSANTVTVLDCHRNAGAGLIAVFKPAVAPGRRRTGSAPWSSFRQRPADRVRNWSTPSCRAGSQSRRASRSRTSIFQAETDQRSVAWTYNGHGLTPSKSTITSWGKWSVGSLAPG
jgi:hypothetical protein